MKLVVVQICMLILISSTHLACKNIETHNQLQGLAKNSAANNIALIFTGTNENGRRQNIERMTKLFSEDRFNLKYQIHHNVGKKEILELTTEAAGLVGDDGTLVWYMNSHGSSGGLTTAGGWMTYDHVLAAVSAGEGRQGNPMARLTAFVDSCYAGVVIDKYFQKGQGIDPNSLAGIGEIGSGQIGEASFHEGFLGNSFNQQSYSLTDSEGTQANNETLPYKEALVLTSSLSNQSSSRHKFSSSLVEAFDKVKTTETVTVGQYLREVADAFGKRGQRPKYKAYPNDNLLNEPLFADGNGSENSTPGARAGKDIAVKLGLAPLESQMTPFYASLPQNIHAVSLCLGAKAQCIGNGPDTTSKFIVDSRFTNAVNRRVFRGQLELSKYVGKYLTVLGFDGTGANTKASHAITIQIGSNG